MIATSVATLLTAVLLTVWPEAVIVEITVATSAASATAGAVVPSKVGNAFSVIEIVPLVKATPLTYFPSSALSLEFKVWRAPLATSWATVQMKENM